MKIVSDHILKYVRFFWSISWRLFFLALLTAVFTGIGLGMLSRLNDWPPHAIPMIASLVGLPITLLTGSFIVWKQTLRFYSSYSNV